MKKTTFQKTRIHLYVFTLLFCFPFLTFAQKKESDQDSFKNAISKPLVRNMYTADPSTHVFNNRIYIYGSHDIETHVTESDNGDHFQMKDYHVLSMDSPTGKVTDHGVALSVENIPWAGKQLWAPDAAYRNNTYYLYFPLKDKEGIFRIGVATSERPEGPFKAEKEPIKGTYSMDPAVFKDSDGSFYLYFGGLHGGQLQRWKSGEFNKNISDKGDGQQKDEPALTAKVAKLSADMKQLAEVPKDVVILDEKGNTILSGDHDRRFFEGSWLHQYKGKYYFSYSTGDTHKLVYATGDSPYGPFTYKGVILLPVIGWTTHHSIVEFKNKWWLYYHDTELSKGKTHLRNIKVTELKYKKDGSIITIDPYGKK
ncbi:glycoside hydrolase family 43 protein [Sphingobacterium spiritivorum]|uniref:glycoside hydrolase family 43 protein n=1 Tax=Sphingobacterium spiritivorum TaxID=258 RepID=UPI003DA244A0